MSGVVLLVMISDGAAAVLDDGVEVEDGCAARDEDNTAPAGDDRRDAEELSMGGSEVTEFRCVGEDALVVVVVGSMVLLLPGSGKPPLRAGNDASSAFVSGSVRGATEFAIFSREV